MPAVGDVTAAVEHGAALNGHLLEMDEEGAVLARLGGDVPLDISELLADLQLGEVEQVLTQGGG
jgi:hypothetical protein